MKTLLKKLLVIGFTILIISSAHAQNPLQGTWQNTFDGTMLNLQPNFRYVLKYSNGTQMQGQYGLQNGYLLIQNPNTGQVMNYWLQYYDNQSMILVDAMGNTFNYSQAVPPQTQDIQGTVLAKQNGHLLKTGHVEVYQKFTRFIISQALSYSEKAAIQADTLKEFKTNPIALLKDVAETDQAMQQAYQLNNPIQIGLVRQALIAELHKATRQMFEAQKPALIKIINRHAPVLAFDESTNLAFTLKDFEGLLNYTRFMNELLNQPFTITEVQKQQFKREIIGKFASLPLEQKQMLCVTNLLYQVIDYNWKRLSHEQQQAYKQQMIAQNVAPQQMPATPQVSEPPIDTNDPAALYAYQLKMQQEREYWTMMSNISMQSHVTSMNIIENMGGTDNYWEIVDY
ncbi:hypothetical protein PN36_24495 [Candidatus Thiomargarita nelsonii]|uniref:Secreted protein n=1 Tax=Candidatus Thiomargarita nelsonii TaxID=1003181 RepID=A0A0A6PI90_9GAMM|nr:hypothetical protein PN36_24495 [Candidatus Thiomargarita nelsonii]